MRFSKTGGFSLCALKVPGRGAAVNKSCTELCHLHARND